MKKGIELEYWLVDDQGRLKSAVELAERYDFADPELLEPLLEIKTEPFESIDELRQDIKRKMLEVLENDGVNLVPTGTAMNSKPLGLVGRDRFTTLKKFNEEDIQVERRLARAGTHIHFEKENVKDQFNLLTALNPASALLNSSPYSGHEKVASSSRNYVYIYETEHKFPENVHLWDYIDSKKDWITRVDECFQRFRDEALRNGVTEKEFEDNYTRNDVLWIPIRLRDTFPTVEYRAPDSALPSQILRLAEKFDQLLEDARKKELEIGDDPGIEEDKITLPGFTELEELSRKSAKEGIESGDVSSYLQKMGFEPGNYSPLASADFMDAGKTIDDQKVREIRLKAAKKLEKDVQGL